MLFSFLFQVLQVKNKQTNKPFAIKVDLCFKFIDTLGYINFYLLNPSGIPVFLHDFFKSLGLEAPLPFRISNSLPWRVYGYFWELHFLTNDNVILRDFCIICMSFFWRLGIECFCCAPVLVLFSLWVVGGRGYPSIRKCQLDPYKCACHIVSR